MLSNVLRALRRVSPHCMLCFDLDYFYCQVELLARPQLRTVPVAVTQKYLVVTCNYAARAAGVRKLQRTTDALASCPALVLINGEDLTRYRAASERVRDCLRSANVGPVQRLALDEFVVDATEEATERVRAALASKTAARDILRVCHPHEYAADVPFGSVRESYDALAAAPCASDEGFACLVRDVLARWCSASRSARASGDAVAGAAERLLVCEALLAQGAAIASELRARLRESDTVRLTASSGIASSWLVAKIATNVHKPDQQTVVPARAAVPFMHALGVREVPGIGRRLSHLLKDKGITRVSELAALSKDALVCLAESERLGAFLFDACVGASQMVVEERDAPRSISSEDSLRGLCTVAEADRKVAELARRLCIRVVDDAARFRRLPRVLGVRFRLGPTDDERSADGFDAWAARPYAMDRVMRSVPVPHALALAWNDAADALRQQHAVAASAASSAANASGALDEHGERVAGQDIVARLATTLLWTTLRADKPFRLTLLNVFVGSFPDAVAGSASRAPTAASTSAPTADDGLGRFWQQQPHVLGSGHAGEESKEKNCVPEAQHSAPGSPVLVGERSEAVATASPRASTGGDALSCVCPCCGETLADLDNASVNRHVDTCLGVSGGFRLNDGPERPVRSAKRVQAPSLHKYFGRS